MDNLIRLTICTDNGAFGETFEDCAAETARILRALADRLESEPRYMDPTFGAYPVMNDINGNRVGSFSHGWE